MSQRGQISCRLTLKDLQSENQALKQIVAEQALLIEASKKLLRKNGFRPPTEGRGPAS